MQRPYVKCAEMYMEQAKTIPESSHLAIRSNLKQTTENIPLIKILVNICSIRLDDVHNAHLSSLAYVYNF